MAPPRSVSSPPRRTDAAQIDSRRQKPLWLPSSAVRQLTFQGPGELVWEDVPTPQLEGEGDALVRPVAVATCDLDAALARGQAPLPGPFAFGHEFVADVIEVSDGVAAAPGRRVIVPFQVSCGACPYCARGLT